MVVNFRAYGTSRGAHKLARTPTLNKKKNIKPQYIKNGRKKKIPKTSHQALSKILETDRTSRKMTLGTSHFTLIYGHDAMLLI
jgi:deferrochelatase/peroxidase EfeB